VLARSAAAAEALSTALLVQGRGGLAETARRFGVDVCWIDRHGIWTSPWFPLRPL
jgi:thiamine biosynthesis lipoprotein ApbE